MELNTLQKSLLKSTLSVLALLRDSISSFPAFTFLYFEMRSQTRYEILSASYAKLD